MKFIKFACLIFVFLILIGLIAYVGYFFQINQDVWVLISLGIGWSLGMAAFYFGLLIVDGDL